MAFNANDYYTVVDGVKLYGYWNPFVTKFSADSFYNWEQDNLPLYDLEERTEFLWERSGWAGSSLPGLALIVEDVKEEGNNNSFDSLQDALDALPDVIRMPIMIEVIKTGDLGKLDVKNIKFGEGGSLEILNTCRIDINSSEYKTAGIEDHDANRYTFFAINNKATNGQPTLDALTDTVSLVRSGYNLADNGYFPAIGETDGSKFKGAFFISPVGTNTGSKHRPDRPTMHSYEMRPLSDGVDTDGNYDAWAGNSTILTRDFAGEYTNFDDPTKALDLTSVFSRSTAGDALTVGHGVAGTWTNNVLRGINIVNCDGPIYIRGFIVDGTDTTTFSDKIVYQDFGINIQNCQKVYIENCASMRNRVGGLLATDSDLVLNRKFQTGRNHTMTTEEERSANEHYGMKLVNTNLTLSSDSYCNGQDAVFMFFENDYGIHMSNSVINGVKTSATTVATQPSIKCCYNKKAGIHSENSTVTLDCDLDMYSNQLGMKLMNSNISVFRMFAQYNFDFGIDAYSSNITYGKEYSADLTTTRVSRAAANQLFVSDSVQYDYDIVFFGNGRHIRLDNSQYKPVYQLNMPNRTVAGVMAGHTSVTASNDISHYNPAIQATNSQIDLIHHKINTTQTGGTAFGTEVDVAEGTSLGTVLNLINSHANILGTGSMAAIISGPAANNRHTALHVSKNSSCRLSGPVHISGFKNCAVVDLNSSLDMSPHEVEGTYTLADAVFNLDSATNHTSIELLSHGECLIVDNNSTLNMRDLGCAIDKYPDLYKTSSDIAFLSDTSSLYHGGGIILAPNNPDEGGAAAGGDASITIAPTNFVFTSDNLGIQENKPYNFFILGGSNLEEGSFRTYSEGGVCLQAHNNSTVKVHNVCFHTGAINADDVFYESGTLAGCADLRIWSFATGASLDAAHLAVSGSYPSLAGYHGPRATYFSSYADPMTYNKVAYTAFRQYPYGFSGSTSDHTIGKVDPVSGLVVELDHYSGSAVSGGTHPYVGSLAVLDYFGSGVIASGPPDFSLTNYTNYIRNASLSRYDSTALDTALGLGGNASKFWGASGYENTGPFRLYLEPDPICQYLVYMSGTEPTNWGCPSGFAASADNRVYQTISQGYHLSGPVSGDPYYLTTWKPSLQYAVQERGGNISREVSGYPDVAQLVRPQNYNIRLDESAAHSFANAKHCSINFLGRPPLVQIYRNGLAAWGARQDISNQDEGYGYGFKSPHTYHDRRQ